MTCKKPCIGIVTTTYIATHYDCYDLARVEILSRCGSTCCQQRQQCACRFLEMSHVCYPKIFLAKIFV